VSGAQKKSGSKEHDVISVLIADDHPIVRRGLKHILADTRDIGVAGEATSGREVLAWIRERACDVLLLDLSMPGGHGLDILQQVRRECPRLPVLVLSVHPEDQYGLRVLKAGAAGYMSKESAPEELIHAIRKVHAGGRYVTPRLAEAMVIDLGGGHARLPHERLSEREYQVLCLLGNAMPVRQIARELHLSAKTVSTYRARLLEKMGVRSTAELIRYAVRNRLVD